MALITGINIYTSKATISAADLDSDFDKIVTQIGGLNSAGASVPGNLDSTNFSPNAGFSNDQKSAPNAWFAAEWWNPFTTFTSVTTKSGYTFRMPSAGDITGVSFAFGNTVTVANQACQGNVILKKNGTTILTLAFNMAGTDVNRTNWVLGAPATTTVAAGDLIETSVQVTSFSGGATGITGLKGQLAFSLRHIS